MKTIITAIALAIISSTAAAQEMFIGDRMQIGGQVEQALGPASIDEGFVKFQTHDGKRTLMSIGADGSVAFSYTATVRWTNTWLFGPEAVGPTRGYLLVFVNGEPALLELRYLAWRAPQ